MRNTFPTQSRRRNEGAQSATGERSLRYNSKAVDVACIRSSFLVRTCVRAGAHAFQQQFSFFAVTSVTLEDEKGGREERTSGKIEGMKSLFFAFVLSKNEGRNQLNVKIHLYGLQWAEI